jgi:hypothetical protein
VARRAREHVEVTNVPSRNPKADYFEERGATFGIPIKNLLKKIVVAKGCRFSFVYVQVYRNQ